MRIQKHSNNFLIEQRTNSIGMELIFHNVLEARNSFRILMNFFYSVLFNKQHNYFWFLLQLNALCNQVLQKYIILTIFNKSIEMIFKSVKSNKRLNVN